jgi:hypothetical protein
VGKGLASVPRHCRWEAAVHGPGKIPVSSYEYMRIDPKNLQRKCIDEWDFLE